jgi:hypothetical protein
MIGYQDGIIQQPQPQRRQQLPSNGDFVVVALARVAKPQILCDLLGLPGAVPARQLLSPAVNGCG